MTDVNPDDLLRDQLAAHNPMWKALADTLDEWQWRMHGASSGHHSVGAFLRFLDKNGWQVTAKPRTFTELQLLAAVEAERVWHEYDHNDAIYEDDEGQEIVTEQIDELGPLVDSNNRGRYYLDHSGKERLAELRAAASQ